MAETKVTSAELGPNKTTDTNGWTKYDYGTWKQYIKRVTFSQTIGGGAILTLSSNNLPVGISDLSTVFIQYSYTAASNAYALSIVFEGGSTTGILNFTTNRNDGSTSAYTGFIDVTLTSS